jgi:hypothetical protein
VGCSACDAISTSKHLPNNTCWRLACVTDLVGGSSLDAVKTSPKKCLLLPDTCLFQRSFSMHHAHTSFLSFTCSTYKARQACKSEAQIMQREHPNCTIFRIFFLPVRGGWRSCDFVAPQAGSTALGIRGLKRAKNGLLSADRSCQRPHRSPVSTLVHRVSQQS